MFFFLRWIEDIDWRAICLVTVFSYFTLSLVFAGSLNEAVESRTQAKSLQINTEIHRMTAPTDSAPTSTYRHALSKSWPSSQSPATEAHHDITLLLDLSKNLLHVKEGEHIVYSALAATGSGKMLRDPHDPSRTWKFETPRGSFQIENKLEKPVWIRPDWAFIEKGLPVPKERTRRLLPNVLGDYALGFGDGYFIHGALYTYLLGFNVTHGCIQLNDEDLRYMYETIPVGAKLEIV